MIVLSLFDGISCGRVALERAGIDVDTYYASEIDKQSMTVSHANYPDIIQLGDINNWRNWNIDWSKIDLLIGGSPCQGFSFAGKQLNFNDPRSKLFFVYADILNHIKSINPNVKFLLENVCMKQEYEDVITKFLGVDPVMINSALVSAQTRKRLYWTNIAQIDQPQDRNIELCDILEDIPIQGIHYYKDGLNSAAVRGRRIGELHKATIIGRRLNEDGHRDDYNKTVPITQCLEVRATNTNKSNCLTTVAKDNVLTPLSYGRHRDAFKNNLPFRYYTVKEYCRLQTLPDNYCDSIKESYALKALGNGWTVDVIAHIFSYLHKEKL